MPRLPFSWILPLGQLLLCAILIWPFRVEIASELRMAYRYYRAGIPHLSEFPELPPGSKLVIDLDDPEVERRERVVQFRIWTPALLNLPAGLVQLPYVILNPTKTEWTPKGMWFVDWRAISWPVIGLIFWWVAGRGLEALFAARRGEIAPRIGWGGTLAGLLLFAMGLIVCIAMLAERSDDAAPVPWTWSVAGGGIWVVLGGSVVASRIWQWRIRRELRYASSSTGNAQE